MREIFLWKKRQIKDMKVRCLENSKETKGVLKNSDRTTNKSKLDL